MLAPCSLRLLYLCWSPGIHKLLLTIHPWYISNQHSVSRYIKKLMKHWRVLPYVVFNPIFLLVSIALTIINTVSACLCDLHVGRINQGTFGAVLTSRCSGHSGLSMLFSCSISDSTSAAQSSSLSFGLSKSPFQLSQASVSEMLWGVRSSSLLIGWHVIL